MMPTWQVVGLVACGVVIGVIVVAGIAALVCGALMRSQDKAGY